MTAGRLWETGRSGERRRYKRCRDAVRRRLPFDMTETAQYGPVFSQQRPPMERGGAA